MTRNTEKIDAFSERARRVVPSGVSSNLHCWNVETGIPTEDALAALGIEDLCSDLRHWGEDA